MLLPVLVLVLLLRLLAPAACLPTSLPERERARERVHVCAVALAADVKHAGGALAASVSVGSDVTRSSCSQSCYNEDALLTALLTAVSAADCSANAK